MADKKISQLTALSAANLAPSTDVLAIVDTSATETKKIVAQDLINGVLNVASAVGIGTASPGAKLTIAQSSNVITQGLLLVNAAGTQNGGWYHGGSALIGRENGVDTIAIAAGNVGIGTASPGTKLDVNGDIRASNEIYLDNGKYLRFKRSSGGLSIQTLGIESGTDNVRLLTTGAFNIVNGSLSNMLTLDASGNLGVGTTSPVSALHIQRGASAAAYYAAAANNATLATSGFLIGQDAAGLSRIYQYGSNPMTFWINDTERGRFSAGGYFKASSNGTYVGSTGAYHELVQTIGATTAVEILWNTATSGNNIFLSFQTDANLERGTIDYNRAGGLTRYNTTSDYRAKDVYGLLDDSGETIDALKVYRGKMHGATMERPMLIAHEAQEVAPYAVTGEKDAVNDDGDPIYQQMDTSSLVPLLIAEIQSLRSRVSALEAK